MSKITVNFQEKLGKIKPMHAVNNGPAFYLNERFWEEAKQAGIPFARTHDTSGCFGGTVFIDVPNIFRNFDADETDPNNYDFAFTDFLFKFMARSGIKPFYRLGVTIENWHAVKAYNIYPPKDYEKWARICEHIIWHYNEGWAHGYYYNIEYWEIWNEPDNQKDIWKNPMWKGTAQDYYRLYEVSANHLKKVFPNIKIGGYAGCGFYKILENTSPETSPESPRNEYFAKRQQERNAYWLEFFEGFLKYITSKAHKAPLDFFSYHSYDNDCNANASYQAFVRQRLDDYGFTETETVLNEWNPGNQNRGKIIDASNILSNMITLQDSSLDMLMYYDGRPTSTWCGLWSYERGILKGYYAFLYFNGVYKCKNQVQAESDDKDLFVLASADYEKGAIAIANASDEDKKIELSAENLIGKKWKISKTTAETDDEVQESTCDGVLMINLPARAVMLIENE